VAFAVPLREKRFIHPTNISVLASQTSVSDPGTYQIKAVFTTERSTDTTFNYDSLGMLPITIRIGE
jgi:hypothetical protein